MDLYHLWLLGAYVEQTMHKDHMVMVTFTVHDHQTKSFKCKISNFAFPVDDESRQFHKQVK